MWGFAPFWSCRSSSCADGDPDTLRRCSSGLRRRHHDRIRLAPKERFMRPLVLHNARLLIAIGVCCLSIGIVSGQDRAATARPELAQPLALPKQVPVKSGTVDVPGARLWYWDTGGPGQVVVLLHPATGSGLIWGYQQPVFANAGYRVIGYSRKNYVHSTITNVAEIGSDAQDLHGLAQALGIEKFHAIGLAAGGGIVMQYAVEHPERLLSMTIACSLGRVRDSQYEKMSAALRPKAFYKLPPEFRELGPCYRARNPTGVKQWLALQQRARPDRPFVSNSRGERPVLWGSLSAAKVPTLLVSGDADLYMPPPMLKYFHEQLPGSEMEIIDGCGHSAYWEQPQLFNELVIRFLTKHLD